jgi:hypothetical protein
MWQQTWGHTIPSLANGQTPMMQDHQRHGHVHFQNQNHVQQDSRVGLQQQNLYPHTPTQQYTGPTNLTYQYDNSQHHGNAIQLQGIRPLTELTSANLFQTLSSNLLNDSPASSPTTSISSSSPSEFPDLSLPNSSSPVTFADIPTLPLPDSSNKQEYDIEGDTIELPWGVEAIISYKLGKIYNSITRFYPSNTFFTAWDYHFVLTVLLYFDLYLFLSFQSDVLVSCAVRCLVHRSFQCLILNKEMYKFKRHMIPKVRVNPNTIH